MRGFLLGLNRVARLNDVAAVVRAVLEQRFEIIDLCSGCYRLAFELDWVAVDPAYLALLKVIFECIKVNFGKHEHGVFGG